MASFTGAGNPGSGTGSDLSFIDQGDESVTLNKTNYLDSPRIIASRINETSQPAMSELIGNRSLSVELSLQTSDSRLSPVVDGQRASVCLTTNRVNNPITDYVKDLFVRFRPYPFFRGGKKRKTRRKLRKRKKKTKRKRKRKSNKTRRKYNIRKKIKKRRKTKRVIKGGGKKHDNLMAEIYLNRDMILGHYPKPLTDQEAHSLTVATEESMYDALPVNNDPNEDRIAKYMIARKFWRPKTNSKKLRNKENNFNSMNFTF